MLELYCAALLTVIFIAMVMAAVILIKHWPSPAAQQKWLEDTEQATQRLVEAQAGFVRARLVQQLVEAFEAQPELVGKLSAYSQAVIAAMFTDQLEQLRRRCKDANQQLTGAIRDLGLFGPGHTRIGTDYAGNVSRLQQLVEELNTQLQRTAAAAQQTASAS